MAETDDDARMSDLVGQMDQLRTSVLRLEAESQSLKKWRSVAILIGLLGCASPTLFFSGWLSPRLDKLHVTEIDVGTVSAQFISVQKPGGPGRPQLSMSTSDTGALLSLTGSDTTATTSVGTSGASISLVTPAQQTIFLTASSNAVLGANVVVASSKARGSLTANGNGGDAATVDLTAPGGTSTLSARRYAGKDPFVGGLEIARNEPMVNGATAELQVGSSGPSLRMEEREKGTIESIALSAMFAVPSIFITHGKDDSKVGGSVVSLLASSSGASIHGLFGDQETWALPTKRP